MSPDANVPRRDLDEIIDVSGSDLRVFKGAHMFITGGSGFVGSWLLESLAWANARLGARVTVTALVRDVDRFTRSFPHLAAAAGFRYVQGDVTDPPADLGHFDVVVHAATQPADGEIAARQPDKVFDVALAGMRFALSLASASGGIPILFTSSGAVYGKQPANVPALPEDYSGAPDSLNSALVYHEAKRACEMLCALASTRGTALTKIARLFAFLGPRLPHDRQFAAGNFIANAVAGQPITVKSDGSAIRSYLYPSDMVIALWAILARGAVARAYNVGSDHPVQIKELARIISGAIDTTVPVQIQGSAIQGRSVDRYVPNIDRIRTELGIVTRVPLDEAVSRTIAFYRSGK